MQATASMTDVFETGNASVFAVRTSYQGKGSGTIDANNLANFGLNMRHYSLVRISGLLVTNGVLGGIELGDGAESSGDAYLSNNLITRNSSIAYTGTPSAILQNTLATDTFAYQNELVGYAYGITANTSGNYYVGSHAWAYSGNGPLLTAFQDLSGANFWIDDEPDSPSTYGWLIGGANTTIIGPRCWNGTSGPDNSATCFHFTNSNPVTANIIGGFVAGASSSHRWANDYDSTAQLSSYSTFSLNVVNSHPSSSFSTLGIGSQTGFFSTNYPFFVSNTGATRGLHFKGGSGTPGIAAGGAISTTPTIAGNDFTGTVTVPSTAITTGTIATLTFATAYTSAPTCSVTQNGGLVAIGVGHGTPGTGSFTITAAIANVSAAAYLFDYVCTGN